jgi:hypothetical protein
MKTDSTLKLALVFEDLPFLELLLWTSVMFLLSLPMFLMFFCELMLLLLALLLVYGSYGTKRLTYCTWSIQAIAQQFANSDSKFAVLLLANYSPFSSGKWQTIAIFKKFWIWSKFYSLDIISTLYTVTFRKSTKSNVCFRSRSKMYESGSKSKSVIKILHPILQLNRRSR